MAKPEAPNWPANCRSSWSAGCQSSNAYAGWNSSTNCRKQPPASCKGLSCENCYLERADSFTSRFVEVERLSPLRDKPGLFPHLYPQFLQLSLTHRSRRIHHQIHRPRRLGEGNDFAQAISAGQDHHNAIESERDASVWRCAIFQRFEKKAKAGTRLFFRHAQGAKDLALNILAMNADRT